ncbi:MAG: hypothetical protein HYV97_01430 [Bdellovibrio sp.]|nr:hypothetical protein [Bdellovibrio sp.]
MNQNHGAHFRMLKISGLILSLLLFQTASATYVWRQNHTLSEKIGNGYITSEQFFTPPCIVPTFQKTQRPAYGVLENFLEISQQRFESELLINGEVSLADLLFFDVTGRFSARDFVSVNQLRQRHVFKAEIYSGSYALVGYTLSQRGKKAQQMNLINPEQVKTMCGDAVVNEVHLGGQLYIMLDFDFKTTYHRIDFSVAAEVKIIFGKITISVSKVAEHILKNAMVSIRIAQIGGDPVVLKNLKKETQISCRLDQLDHCHEAVEKIYGYLRSDFRKQITPQTYDHELARNGSVIAYGVKAYKEAGIDELSPPVHQELPPSIKESLEKMLSTSTQYTEYREQMELFLLNDRDLDKSLRNKYKRRMKILEEYIVLLNQFYGICYRNHDQCSPLMQELYSRGVFNYREDL